MRILMVGVGGAGSRIADMLYEFDQRSRILRCTGGIAVDRDPESLGGLRALPKENILFAHTLDPTHVPDGPVMLPHDEIIARLQALDPGDIDALVICLGLGGSMAGEAHVLAARIRKTMIEPAFGLFTLPCDREGREILGEAADQIERLSPVLDGMILFDNEIWFERVKNDPALQPPPAPDGGLLPSRSKQQPHQPEHVRVYEGINRIIAQRVNLFLRAGEAGDRPGAEVGEVALDAGEIVNTLRGMGPAAIGFAREAIPRQTTPDLLKNLRPAERPVQESHEKASRILALGKQAVSEELSVACDVGDAERALVLLAGPAEELNMRGYLAFRHWINTRIHGSEVRSGDYPIPGSGYVAVAVILSGLSRVPRLDAIREARDRDNQAGG